MFGLNFHFFIRPNSFFTIAANGKILLDIEVLLMIVEQVSTFCQCDNSDVIYVLLNFILVSRSIHA